MGVRMYLKSIEVQGFKSFAHKMVFEFHDGITAIVGPNGSGKSNVGDAMRWVLGEQSAKQLRGNKMEDIIFAGTEARKPLGFAYVAITLDNTNHQLPIDYEEVKVARRVFRSGESEYMINGTSCRLRDIQELFLDTGIGKEGYSIIGQGQIEKILNGKPEDRRELFDEAAGIVKFKKRKLQAAKDLEGERANLLRINDILSEIEKQVGPLEKQSKVAKEYLHYRDELRSLDAQMFLMEYNRIEEEQTQLKEKVQITTNDFNSTKDSLELAKIEYSKLEEALESSNQAIDEKKNDLNNNKLKMQELEGEIKVIKEQINASQQNDVHYNNRLSAIQADLTEREGVYQTLLSEYEAKQLEYKHLNVLKQEKQHALSLKQKELNESSQQIEKLKSDIFELMGETSSLNANAKRYETIIEQNNIKRVSLTQKILKAKSDEAVCEEKIQNQKELLQQIAVNLAALTEEMKVLSDEITALVGQEKNLGNEIDHTRQEFHQEKSRLNYLSNLTERYEGYGNSIRKVMEQKDVEPGIHGVVADIIKVNKEYEVAVETALGGSIQNIVTEDENTAKRMIEFLKKNRFGRATFLPLTSMHNKSTFYNEDALHEPGVIGLASTLVTSDSDYKNLVEYLLGRVLVVDHIDNAIALAKKYKYSLRIVTIEGEQLNPGGSMSGGAFKNSSNLLGRRRELEDITKHLSKLEVTLSNFDKQYSSCQAKRLNTEKLLNEKKASYQEQMLKQNTEKLNLNQAIVDLSNVKHNYEEIHRENIEIDTQAEELKRMLGELTDKQELIQSEITNKEQHIQTLNGRIEEIKKEISAFEQSYSELLMEANKAEQQLQFNNENVKRVKEEMNRLKNEQETIFNTMKGFEETISEKQQSIELLQQQIRDYAVSIASLEETIATDSVKREELNKEYKDFFNKREELSNRIATLDKELFRLGNQLDKLTEQLETCVNYMWEEYQLTYSVALTMQLEEEFSLSKIKKMIADIKASMKALGDVNVNAIDDYKNLLERYELLKTQRDDLVAAEKVLLDIIEELDTEMRKQFEDKFGYIQAQFDKVFKQLFGGGKGTLELVEEEDILEAGIRINAQPPGKKLQNMMQLSGGEKALTAICLLFAIQSLKPSPFCLLDEIEAALDEQNVVRYAKYLKKLSSNTQFIVITHRRGTMNTADRLYGITMQEKGVSTMVSVNLIQDELETK